MKKLLLFCIFLVQASLAGDDVIYRVSPLNQKLIEEALAAENIKKVASLIEQGANVNATDQHGRPVLTLVLLDEKYEVAKLLIKQGADINATDEDGRTVLMSALLDDKYEVVKFLIKNVDLKHHRDNNNNDERINADINTTDRRTIFMSALLDEKYEQAKSLIKHDYELDNFLLRIWLKSLN